MQRFYLECRGKLTPISDTPEMTSAEKTYGCSACQLRFVTDATGFLREIEGRVALIP